MNSIEFDWPTKVFYGTLMAIGISVLEKFHSNAN